MVRIALGTEGEACILKLSGRIDAGSSAALRDALFRLTEAETPTIVLDMGELESVDSAGIATLLEGLARTWYYGGDLHLTEVPARVRSVIEIFRLQTLLLPDRPLAAAQRPQS
jgi:anti-anti-sigma factor